jgi:hypothetical protein
LFLLDGSSEFFDKIPHEGICLGEQGKFFESLRLRFRSRLRRGFDAGGPAASKGKWDIGQINLDEIEKTFSSAAPLHLFQGQRDRRNPRDCGPKAASHNQTRRGKKKKYHMTPQKLLISHPSSLLRRGWALILLAVGSFALCQQVQSATDTPDPGGSLPVSNTADGHNALLSLITGGTYNSAFGFDALLSLTDGDFCTAVGGAALILNTGSQNTAVGAGALLSNTTGDSNTAVGAFAMFNNAAGPFNTAVGFEALMHATANANAAVGDLALINVSTGFFNTAIGAAAGENQTTGHNNVYIGQGSFGVPGESNTCYIQGIFGQTVDPATAALALVDTNGKLGTVVSSQRFKKDIEPMDKASEAVLSLKPVTFHYKSDKKGTPQCGLIAEEVAKVDPNLVVRDKNGEILSVHYDQVWNMMLNEFLKEHQKVKDLEATVAQQRKGMEILTAQLKEEAAQIQKVSAQLEMNKPAAKVVVNKP